MFNWSPLKFDVAAGIVILLLLTFAIYNHHKSKQQEPVLDESLNIKNIIHNVQQELAQSEKERNEMGLPSLFEVKTFDLEINFVVKAKYTVRGEVDGFNLIAVSADTETASERVQKVTVHMSTVPQTIVGRQKPSDKPIDPPGDAATAPSARGESMPH